MLFSSAEYMFVFLPLTLLLYFTLRKFRLYRLSLCWLTLASLFFYGWWNPRYLVLLLTSMISNYLMGRLLYGLWLRKDCRSGAVVLTLSVGANLALLGYFKYANCFIDTISA